MKDYLSVFDDLMGRAGVVEDYSTWESGRHSAIGQDGVVRHFDPWSSEPDSYDVWLVLNKNRDLFSSNPFYGMIFHPTDWEYYSKALGTRKMRHPWLYVVPPLVVDRERLARQIGWLLDPVKALQQEYLDAHQVWLSRSTAIALQRHLGPRLGLDGVQEMRVHPKR